MVFGLSRAPCPPRLTATQMVGAHQRAKGASSLMRCSSVGLANVMWLNLTNILKRPPPQLPGRPQVLKVTHISL